MIHEKILASLRQEINEQTAQMHWSELERFFASGNVISIAPELDLIDVGARIAADDKTSVQDWMSAGLLYRVTDVQANAWVKSNTLQWTVVVKPWMLEQHDRIQPTATSQ